MKVNYKRIIAVILSALIAMSAFMSMTVFAASNTLSYTFSGEDSSRAGFAEGTITLTASAGTYYLYWADDTKALDGYDKLCSMTLSTSGSKTHSMLERSAIPADATKLIATTSENNKTVSGAAAVYNIPASKLWSHKSFQRNYRFASYSDVHIDGTYDTYGYADEHWRDALDTAAARDAEFIVLSGDYVNNNKDYSGISNYEWRTYQRVLSESDYCNPVYEAIGNHELWQDITGGTNDFKLATGLGSSDGSSSSKAYFEKTLNGDHFIFMAMEGGFYPDRTEEFTTAQLDWLEGLLKKYTGDGHNIYIIEHSQFYKYGAGDNVNGEPYYDIPLKDDQESSKRFKSLLNSYKDVIFLSGHTHIAFKEQYNFSDNNGTSAQMIHNSSVGGTRPIVGGTLDRQYPRDQTEGYIVDVYDDAIIFNGANLYYNLYDPNCCYVVKTSAEMCGKTVQSNSKAKAPVGATATSYYVKGSFNNWGTANPLYTTDTGGVYETTIQLSAGTYTFKINNGSTWYGNGGTIQDTTKTTSQGGWIFDTGSGNCTLVASGGYYTFNFNTTNNKLNLLYSTTAATQATTAATQATTAATQATTEPISYTLGDVNDDGKINIRDVTFIQLALIKKISISSSQMKAADVDLSGNVNINDATYIQQYLVQRIVDFSDIAQSASENTKTAAKNNLSLYYRYSSYDAYQALKKAYRNGSSESVLSAANASLLSIVDSDCADSYDKVTVFFEKPDSWGTPYAYCYGRKGSGEDKAWPGAAMTYAGSNNYGKSVYKYTTTNLKRNHIIFSNNGSNQTGAAVFSDYMAYYLDGSNNIVSYIFNDSYIN